MTFLEYLLTFSLAFIRPEFGLIILTFALASVGLIWSSTSIGGLGSVQLSDFAVLGLTVHLICNPQHYCKRQYGIWLLITLWALGIALVHGITQPGGIKLAYDLAVRYGLLWLIPIIVDGLGRTQRRTLLVGMLACGVLVTGILLYTYIDRNPAFAVRMYYQVGGYSASNTLPELHARHELSSNAFPRLYPNGALLVQSLLIFVLANTALLDRSRWPKWLMAALLCIYTVFVISLRQRSSVMSLAVVVCLLLLSRPDGKGRLRIAARILGFGAAAVFVVLAYQTVSGADFLTEFTNRFQNQQLVDTNRTNDNWLALTAIRESPLIGAAHFDVKDLALRNGRASWGLDVNSFLAAAVLGGAPLLLLILLAVWQCSSRCWSILFRPLPTDEQAIAVAMSAAYILCVTILNFAKPFTEPRDLVTLLLFVGLIQSRNLLLPRVALRPRLIQFK